MGPILADQLTAGTALGLRSHNGDYLVTLGLHDLGLLPGGLAGLPAVFLRAQPALVIERTVRDERGRLAIYVRVIAS